MHRASLRIMCVKTCSPPTPERKPNPPFQRGNGHFLPCTQAYGIESRGTSPSSERQNSAFWQLLAQKCSLLALQARFCQSGKSGQVKNKALALRNGNEHMNTEASCTSSKKSEQRQTSFRTSVQCPPKKAKCKNHRAAQPFYIHTPFATSRGNPFGSRSWGNPFCALPHQGDGS